MKFEFFAAQEKNPDLKSRAIMAAIGWDCSHVGVIWNGNTVWHATGEGFNRLQGEKFDEFIQLHNLPHRFDLPVRNLDYARGYCRGNEGKDYSETQFAGFLSPALQKMAHDGERELICSEFVIRFAMDPEICGLAFDQDPDFVDPKRCTKIIYTMVGRQFP